MNTILNNIALLFTVHILFIFIHLEVTFIHNDLQKRNKGNSKEPTVFFIYNSKFIRYLETS